jgi:hypothetical protein
MKYPSVSRILDATMAPEKRAALEAWKQRVGEEEAERIRQAAMARGNVIDEMVETFMDSGECEDTRISEYLNGYQFVAHELVVVSDMNQYQGRLDAVLRINNRNILVDFKGSTKWKPKKYLGDYNHQLGAYYGALMEAGMNIDCACVVLFIDGRDKPQLYWRQLDELQEAHGEFLQRVKQYREQL